MKQTTERQETEEMAGRHVIVVDKAFTLQELYDFMDRNWDRETYNDFKIGKPTPASIEEYILLPATRRFCVIVYSRKAGLLSRKNKVILAVCDTPEGAVNSLIRSIPTRDIVTGAAKIGAVVSSEQERKGPAEEALQQYAAYMRKLLGC